MTTKVPGYLRATVVLVSLCHAALLQIIYVTYVSPIFAYQGMVTRDLPLSLIVVQLLLAIIPAPFMPVELRKPSDFQVLLLFIIVYVPSVIVGYHICDSAKWGGYTLFITTMAACLIFLSRVSRMRTLAMPSWSVKRWHLPLFALVFSAVVYGALVAYYGLPDNLFEIDAIYRSRAGFKERVAEVPLLVNYLYWWQGVVVNPILIVAGMLRRNILLLAAGVLLQYVLFCITTLRTMLLSILFSVFVVLFFRMRGRWKGLKFLASITVAMAACSVLMAGDGIAATGSKVFVQRWLAIQGQLSGSYADFFLENENVNLGDSILKGMVPYRFGDLTPGEVIGDNYVSLGRKPIANATANFWADAFGEFGFTGMFAATLFSFALLWIVDSVFSGYSGGVAIMLFSTCALSLTEQGAQTALLTGGIVPLLFLGMIARRSLNGTRHEKNTNCPFNFSS
jgi:hypothetical protein